MAERCPNPPCVDPRYCTAPCSGRGASVVDPVEEARANLLRIYEERPGEPNHVCGHPDSACDQICVSWAYRHESESAAVAALEAAIAQREAAKWEQRFADLTFELVGTRRLAEARKADLDRMEQRLAKALRGAP